MRNTERPTKEASQFGEVERHPAYAAIEISRISGQCSLFDSDFKHQHYIELRVCPASMDRHLSSDWLHTESRPYIEVAMSESQWATAITSLNSSSTPCTLESFNGELIAGIEKDEGEKDRQFSDEIAQAFEESAKHIDTLLREIEQMKTSAKQKKKLANAVNRIRSVYESTFPFIGKQFSEHMERTKERAKSEIHAHYTRVSAALQLEKKQD